MKVEWQVNPVGVDNPKPKLSWRLSSDRPKAAQTAYQLTVATDKQLLNRDQPDLWDSGRIASSQSVLVPYDGKPLETDRPVFWRVRLWDEAGKPLDWSEVGAWVPGILDAANEWKAQWIGLDKQPDDVPQGANFFGSDEAAWIGAKPGGSPVTYYLKTFDLEAAHLKRAMLGVVCEYDCRVFVNGIEIMQAGDTAGVAPPRYMDITPWMADGKNIVSFWCVASRALRAGIRMEHNDGNVDFVRTDATWTSARGGDITLWDVQKSLTAVTDPAIVLNPTTEHLRDKLLFGPAAIFQPASYLRNEFRVDKPVQSAVLHAASLGLCDLYLNGKEVGAKDRFKPGWSQFDTRRYYVSYDVTSQLRTGVNAWGAILADGWYRGNHAWTGRCAFGDKARFAAQLQVRYADGSSGLFTTGPDWQATFSPFTMADIDCGEDYDARGEMPGWNDVGFDGKGWCKVDVGTSAGSIFDVTAKMKERIQDGRLKVLAQNELVGRDPLLGKQKSLTVKYTQDGKAMYASAREGSVLSIGSRGVNLEIQEAKYGYDPEVTEHTTLSARLTEPVRAASELKAVTITEPMRGVYVFDFGQDAAAWTRLHVAGQRAGDTVLVRYGEFLNPNGTIATINLRAISPHERYICSGSRAETHEARFTYHGFRYAQVVGLRSKPDDSTLTAITANSAGPVTSTFETSSPLINQIYNAITWSQRSNFFEAPTDCPQRDERLGWTGDFQFFGESASFNQEAASFYRKWIEIQIDAQVREGGDTGSFDAAVPSPARDGSYLDWNMSLLRAAWLSHWMYGDDEFLKAHWTGLRSFMGYYERTMATPGDPKILGDWLSSAAMPPKRVIAYAQAVEAYDLFSRLAKDLGYADDAAHFAEKARQARDDFNQKCVNPDGAIEGDTLTGYAMALALHVASDRNKNAVGQNFVRVFEQGKEGMYCGFAGASRILPALTEAGRSDLAAKALLNTEYPSLGFMIKNGATTTWETWGNAPPGSDRNDLNNRVMSQNHYTFASSGAWMFEHLLGISPASPGYQVIHFEPEIVHELRFAKGSILTPYGRVSAGWKRTEDQIVYTIVIPPNASAQVLLAVDSSAKVTLNGTVLTSATVQGEKLLFALASGTYDIGWREK